MAKSDAADDRSTPNISREDVEVKIRRLTGDINDTVDCHGLRVEDFRVVHAITARIIHMIEDLCGLRTY